MKMGLRKVAVAVGSYHYLCRKSYPVRSTGQSVLFTILRSVPQARISKLFSRTLTRLSLSQHLSFDESISQHLSFDEFIPGDTDRLKAYEKTCPFSRLDRVSGVVN